VVCPTPWSQRPSAETFTTFDSRTSRRRIGADTLSRSDARISTFRRQGNGVGIVAFRSIGLHDYTATSCIFSCLTFCLNDCYSREFLRYRWATRLVLDWSAWQGRWCFGHPAPLSNITNFFVLPDHALRYSCHCLQSTRV
jgi:hypothetical protein